MARCGSHVLHDADVRVSCVSVADDVSALKFEVRTNDECTESEQRAHEATCASAVRNDRGATHIARSASSSNAESFFDLANEIDETRTHFVEQILCRDFECRRAAVDRHRR